MKKNKYLLLLIIFTVLFFSASHFANALELTYPSIQIPGLVTPSKDCTGPDCLSIFVAYCFGILVYLAGVLSLISFAIGAVMLINPNLEAHKDAKDRMKGAILGLVLTLVSFLIIRTINPKFITPTLTPLPGVSGVFLTDKKEPKPELKPCPQELSDTARIPEGFNNIKYDCIKDKDGNYSPEAPALLIWIFPKTNFKGSGDEGSDDEYKGIYVRRLTCGNNEISVPVAERSFKMAFETPGIYYYLEKGCNGYMSYANTSSQENIEAPFKGNIKSIKIINNEKNKDFYGVIFHELQSLEKGGNCTEPRKTQPGLHEACIPDIDFNASAADIFKINQTPATSGNGVSFYSSTFQDARGARAGFLDVSNDQIVKYKYVMIGDEMNFLYDGIDRTKEYKDLCKTFKNCPSSIKIVGDYLVGLYSNGSYCQTFKKEVDNLNSEPFVGSGKALDHVYVIPIK